MKFRFSIIIQKEDDWYVARCLENGVASQGKSLEEAMQNIKEALELFLEDNDDIPSVQTTFFTTLEIAV